MPATSVLGALHCIPKGFHAMAASSTILTLAAALKNITDLLGADVFVHDVMSQASGQRHGAGNIRFCPGVRRKWI